MLAVDGGAAQFQNPRSQRLIRSKAELLLGVIAEVAPGRGSRLHPVSPHNAPGGILLELVLDKKVLADRIELVGIQPGPVGTLQPLAQLDIEDFETQPARGIAIFQALGQAQPVTARLGVDARLVWNRRERGSTCGK